jgi:hypothetical protein
MSHHGTEPDLTFSLFNVVYSKGGSEGDQLVIVVNSDDLPHEDVA